VGMVLARPQHMRSRNFKMEHAKVVAARRRGRRRRKTIL
jgi:hypothetical protein